MASPPPPPPPPCCAIVFANTDPAAHHHVVLDIPDLEDPIYQRDGRTVLEEEDPGNPCLVVAVAHDVGKPRAESASVAGEATAEEEDTVGLSRTGITLAVIVGVLFASFIFGFFIWGIVIGELMVLVGLPLVAIVVVFFFCMLYTYKKDTHPIHTAVQKDDVLLVLYSLEMDLKERGKKNQEDLPK